MEKETMETPTPESTQAPITPAKPLSLPIVALVVIAALVVGGVGGYYPGKYQSQNIKYQTNDKVQTTNTPAKAEKEQGGAPVTNIEEQETDPTAEWETYKNTVLGFSLKYPQEWMVIEKPANGYLGYLRVTPMPNKESGIASRWYLSITVGKKDSEYSFEKWVENKTQSTNDPNDLRNIENSYVRKVGGIECSGYHLTLAKTGKNELLFCENNNHFYQIYTLSWPETPSKDTENLNQILSTFEFTD